MCSACGSKNQGVYNTGTDNLDAKPYMDSNGAQTRSGSDSESGLGDPAQSVKFDLAHSEGTSSNTNIGKTGFGA